MAAGLAMLKAINSDDSLFKRLEDKTLYLHKGMTQVLTEFNIDHTVNRVGSMISVHFHKDPVYDFETAVNGNNETFKAFFHSMLKQGIYIAPSSFETWFITDALSYEDLDETINAVRNFAKEL
mgnify:FL=1